MIGVIRSCVLLDGRGDAWRVEVANRGRGVKRNKKTIGRVSPDATPLDQARRCMIERTLLRGVDLETYTPRLFAFLRGWGVPLPEMGAV